MYKSLQVIAIIGILILSSCTSNSNEKDSTEDSEKVERCMYSYNNAGTTLEWTSYKYSTREPVGGRFNEISVQSTPNEDPKKVLESISFSISTASVETDNVERNGKISKLFFDFFNTPLITGKIKSIGNDGKAVIEITMNNIAKDVSGDFTLEDKLFKFNTEIDVNDWDGLSAIQSLNTACKDMHDGGDGISKLWSEVTLSLETELLSDCE